MSAPRRITIDAHANLIEVTNLFDRLGNPTPELALAVTCVLQFGPGQFSEEDIAHVPIYTVH